MSETIETYQKRNINRLEQLFYHGCKSAQTNKLGVELEHFIVDRKTKRALPYAGQRSLNIVLNRLLGYYADAAGVYDTGREASTKAQVHLLGITTKEFDLSLEPAAQLEISIRPTSSIRKIERVYEEFRANLDFILNQMDAMCVTQGYQPKDCADELSLIPKERYIVMDTYFERLGHGGREMMRATASTQISVDYVSCSDFRKKYHTAYVLMPILKYLTDNTLVYEGKTNQMCLRRSDIWSRVDNVRTGIVPGALSPRFSFRDYAEYLWKLPLIYCPKEYLPASFVGEAVLRAAEVGAKKQCERIFAVDNLTSDDIWKKELLSEAAAWHIMSMAFPDVRLKNYVEIRGADALPTNKMLGYAALIKGTLYNSDILERVEQAIQMEKLTETDILKAEKSIREQREEAVVYNLPVKELCSRILNAASDFLPREEKNYLSCFTEIKEWNNVKNNK